MLTDNMVLAHSSPVRVGEGSESMTLTEAPPTGATTRDAEALFKEARRRRRRRWAIGTVAVFAAGSPSSLFCCGPALARAALNVPSRAGSRWTPPNGGSHPAPAFYVAGDGQGGVGLSVLNVNRRPRTEPELPDFGRAQLRRHALG